MPFNRLSTAKIARLTGVHPNTVRLYEAIGWISPAPRSPSGYRLFKEAHIDQMRLARTALAGAWPGRNIRRSLLRLVGLTAREDYGAALEQAYHNLAVVHSERAQAEAAARLLERWAQGAPVDATERPLTIAEAARRLELTPDVLRNWERDGLLETPRHRRNGYRQYGQPEMARLRVIRMLRQAGYSLLAILRMLVRLERGEAQNLRQSLDTPPEDEDIFTAADRWLTTLTQEERRAGQLIEILEGMIGKYGGGG